MRAFQEELQLWPWPEAAEASFLLCLCCTPRGEEWQQCPILELCNSSREPMDWSLIQHSGTPHSTAPHLLCRDVVQHTQSRHALQSLLSWTSLTEYWLCSPASKCPRSAVWLLLFSPAVSHTFFNLSFFSFKEDTTSPGLREVSASALHSPVFPPRPPARRKRYTITPGHLKWDHFNLTYKYGLALTFSVLLRAWISITILLILLAVTG